MSFKKVFSLFASIAIVFSVFSFLAVPIPAEAKACSGSDIIAYKGVTLDAGPSAVVSKIASIKNEFNMNTVRIWQSIPADFSRPSPSSGALKVAKDYHNKGFKVMVVFTYKGSKVPTYAQVNSYFKDVEASSGDFIDFWEMNNEPNLSHYWPGTIEDVITNFQKPAWDALHPKGEYVVSSAYAGAASGVQKLINYGLLGMTDAVAYHPYGDSGSISGRVNEHINKIQTVSNMIGNKPLFITEWNIHAKGLGDDNWAGALDDMYDGIKGCVTGIWYYHSLYTAGTMAGPAGLLYSSGAPHEPFYSALKAVYNGSTYNPDNGGNDGGNTGGGNTGGGTGGGTSVPPLSASCTPSKSTVKVGETVTWRVSPSGSGYRYAWNGTDGLSSTAATVSKSYSTIGPKNAYVTVYNSANNRGTASCSVGVVAAPSPSPSPSGGPVSSTSPSPSATPSVSVSPSVSPSTSITPSPSSNGTPINTGGGSGTTVTINQPKDKSATGLVPCNGPDCDYNKFIELMQNVLNFAFIMVGFIVTMMMLWFGFGYIRAYGNATQMQVLKGRILKTGMGFIIVVSSWLIVNLVAEALLNKEAGYVNPLNPTSSSNTNR